MKIINNLRHTILRRVPIFKSPQMIVKTSEEPSDFTYHVRHRFSVELYVELTGPESERDTLSDQAVRILLKELYGDIADEIYLTLRDLYQENSYRSTDDSVKVRLETLLRKLTQGD